MTARSGWLLGGVVSEGCWVVEWDPRFTAGMCFGVRHCDGGGRVRGAGVAHTPQQLHVLVYSFTDCCARHPAACQDARDLFARHVHYAARPGGELDLRDVKGMKIDGDLAALRFDEGIPVAAEERDSHAPSRPPLRSHISPVDGDGGEQQTTDCKEEQSQPAVAALPSVSPSSSSPKIT